MDHPLYICGPPWRGRPQGPKGWGTWIHDPLHESIAQIKEQTFVDKILKDLHYRSNLFNVRDFDAKDALIKPEVPLRGYRKDLPGEVDILVVPRTRPERATAIQVKRFPLIIKPAEEANDSCLLEYQDWERQQQIAKWQRLVDEGVRQANNDARIAGFSQVYLWFFVLADTRWVNGGRYTYDGPDSFWRSQIDYALSPSGLDARVGVMRFEWVQPMDRPPLELATYGSTFEVPATRIVQPEALNVWLRTLSLAKNDLALR